VLLVPEDSPAAESADAAKEAFRKGTDGVVYSQLRKTPQEAKDAAGAEGDKAFSSGRFLFRGQPADLAKIKKALP
jgi:hypothetical protein